MTRKPPREWEKYTYLNPAGVLVGLREIEHKYIGADIDPLVLRLRTNAQRREREGRVAMLFCYGMQIATGRQISVACVESEDFDCIARIIEEDVAYYIPIQIKELPPEDMSPAATLEHGLTKLTKYADGSDLIVAYHLNRTGQYTLDKLQLPPLRVRELWFFWSCSPAGDNWMMYGNVLTRPSYIPFTYPIPT